MKQMLSVQSRLLLMFFCLCAGSPAAAETGRGLTPLDPREAAPALKLADLDGEIHDLKDYLGRVVIVNFWATWCPPCREEMPSMQRAWEALRQDQVAILAVNVGEDEETLFTFTADYPVEFTLLLDLDANTINSWPVRGLPATYVVDKQGRLAYRAVGGREWDAPEILSTIRKLVGNQDLTQPPQ